MGDSHRAVDQGWLHVLEELRALREQSVIARRLWIGSFACGAFGCDSKSSDDSDDPVNSKQSEFDVWRITAEQQEKAAATIQRHFRRRRERFQRAAKRAKNLRTAISKVAMDNKLGDAPQGWQRDVAFALQKGIKREADAVALPLGTKSKPDVGLTQGPSEAFEPRAPVTPDPEFHAVEPELFARIRAACSIKLARYTAIMGLQEGQTEPNLRLVGTSEAAGKSSSFFFYSTDDQCIIKSCTSEDWRTLLQLLPQYVARFEEAHEQALKMGSNPNNKRSGFMETLLPRYLGLYVLRNILGQGSEMRVVVMLNVFGGAEQIHKRYDLKGSTAGRKASQKELSKKSPVLKDLDWLKNEEKLDLGEADRDRFFAALERDVQCLQSWNLMDYSLLVGIHNRDPANTLKYEVMPVVTIKDTSRLAYVGIVDILTLYGVRKRAETFFKGQLAYGRDVSCQHPRYYGERLLRFILDSVVARTD